MSNDKIPGNLVPLLAAASHVSFDGYFTILHKLLYNMQCFLFMSSVFHTIIRFPIVFAS